MIILNKKRIGIVTGLILIAVFAFTFQKAELNKTVETVTLPVSGKVIVLDARAPENQMRELSLAQEQQRQKQI